MRYGVACLLWIVTFGAVAEEAIHHDLDVTLQPAAHRLEVVDRLALPGREALAFYLHEALSVEVEGGSLRELPVEAGVAATLPLKRYLLTPQVRQLTLRYSGAIDHPVTGSQGMDSSALQETLGRIDAKGVFLASSSVWYPLVADRRLTFEMRVHLPAGWRGVSQGSRLQQRIEADGTEEVWRAQTPQEEIYLIAARFSEYEKPVDRGVMAMAFLRQADEALAQRYLDVTGQYVAMYDQLIGPYPYTKFALVENFWETGYGMPSFTLLGPGVIRLPFIPYTSYPHEILHNWWGNGVYVDYSEGNWAEGLTSYLADHLLKEQRHQGVSFRRNILQGYADFVGQGKDFPLAQFRSRHSASSEAVGYGKGQMLFHMLRRELGDARFVEGLRRLYSQYRFKQAGFADLARLFGEVAGRDLHPFFSQWLERTGAPHLSLGKIRRLETKEGWRLEGVVEQTQPGAPYDLAVPLAITLAGETRALEHVVESRARTTAFAIDLPARPLRLDLDPAFDLFRRVERGEIPPALSLAFGAEAVTFVLPERAPAPLLQAYRSLVSAWRQPGRDTQVVLDSDLSALPADRAVWILGWQNGFARQMAESVRPYGVKASSQMIELNGERYRVSDHAVVLSSRGGAGGERARIWLAADEAAAVAALTRKLPHYRKYSYLVFDTAAVNLAKGQWPVNDSPLSVTLEKGARPASLAPRRPLAQLPPFSSGGR